MLLITTQIMYKEALGDRLAGRPRASEPKRIRGAFHISESYKPSRLLSSLPPSGPRVFTTAGRQEMRGDDNQFGSRESPSWSDDVRPRINRLMCRVIWSGPPTADVDGFLITVRPGSIREGAHPCTPVF